MEVKDPRLPDPPSTYTSDPVGEVKSKLVFVVVVIGAMLLLKYLGF